MAIKDIANPTGTTHALLAGESGKCCSPPVKNPKPMEATMPIAKISVQLCALSGLAIFSKTPPIK
jgi:hypothetical protein